MLPPRSALSAIKLVWGGTIGRVALFEVLRLGAIIFGVTMLGLYSQLSEMQPTQFWVW
jgi:hypothetical protein